MTAAPAIKTCYGLCVSCKGLLQWKRQQGKPPTPIYCKSCGMLNSQSLARQRYEDAKRRNGK